MFAVDDEFKDVAGFQRRMACPILRVGFEHCDRKRFDESFYEQVGIGFDVRYSKFRLPPHLPHEDDVYQALATSRDYCLVHNEGSRGPHHARLTRIRRSSTSRSSGRRRASYTETC